MSNYPGRRKGTRRIVLWRKNRRHEWVVRGTKADGDAFEARKRIELTAQDHETRVAPQFETVCTEKYRAWAEVNLTRATWRSRSNIIVTLCLFFGQKKMDTFTAPDVERFKAHRLKVKIKPSTLNGELRALSRVFRWAAEQGYPVVIPKIRYLKAPRGRVKVWTREQIDAVLTATAKRDPELLRMVTFLLNTGCRKGEAIAAEWSWVDLDRGMLSIPANEAWHPKNATAREVTISDSCRTVLSGPRASKHWVFAKGDGSKYDRFPDAMFKEIQTACGVTGGPHVLRHCYASIFLQKQPDIFVLSKVLGHSSQHTTMMYSHLLPEHLEKSRNAVNISVPIRTVAKAVGRRARRGEKKAFWKAKTTTA